MISDPRILRGVCLADFRRCVLLEPLSKRMRSKVRERLAQQGNSTAPLKCPRHSLPASQRSPTVLPRSHLARFRLAGARSSRSAHVDRHLRQRDSKSPRPQPQASGSAHGSRSAACRCRAADIREVPKRKTLAGQFVSGSVSVTSMTTVTGPLCGAYGARSNRVRGLFVF